MLYSIASKSEENFVILWLHVDFPKDRIGIVMNLYFLSSFPVNREESTKSTFLEIIVATQCYSLSIIERSDFPLILLFTE